VYYYTVMNDYRLKRIEMEWKDFVHSNFEKPSACRDLEQIRYYIREITLRIETEMKVNDYVPDWAYSMLAQYNDVQNKILLEDFKKTYA
jgi:hypothetical protein